MENPASLSTMELFMIHKQSGFTLITKSKKTKYDSAYKISRNITNKSGQDDLLHGLLNKVNLLFILRLLQKVLGK